jgi:Protein of unknown function (DUF3592)
MATKASSARPKTSAAAAGCLAIFGLPFLIAGLVVAGFQTKMVWQAWQMQSWVETPCTIINADLKRDTTGDSDSYKAFAEYSYRFSGVGYRSAQVTPIDSSDNIGSFQQDVASELKAHQQSKQPFRCFVNPAHPEQAVLYPKIRVFLPAFLLLFSLSFPAAGAGLSVFGWLGAREASEMAKRRAMKPAEPWRWKPIWAGDVIPASGASLMVGLAALAVWSGFLIWPLVILWAGSGALSSLSLEWLVLLYPLFWCLFAKTVFTAWRRRYALGTATFQPVDWPGAPGGRLRGAILFSRPLPTQGEVLATLSCERQITTDSGDSSTTTKEKLWSHEERVQLTPAALGPASQRVQVAFAIPADAPPSDMDNSATKHVWTLQAKVTGTPVDLSFEVPVMHTGAQANASSAALQPATAVQSIRQETDSDLSGRLRDSGLEARFRSDGIPATIVCPPGRPAGTLGFLIIFDLVWTALSVLLWVQRAPFIFIAVWTVSSLALWMLIFWIALYRRAASFDSDRIHLKHDLGPFRHWETSLPKSDISGFAHDCNLNSGNTALYRVQAVMKAGRKVTVADGINGSMTAEVLAERMKQWLHPSASGGESRIA